MEESPPKPDRSQRRARLFLRVLGLVLSGIGVWTYWPGSTVPPLGGTLCGVAGMGLLAASFWASDGVVEKIESCLTGWP